MIHPNYRKLCHLLVDCDEWGQIAIIKVLMQYARAHFLDPNEGRDDGEGGEGGGMGFDDKPFYSDDQDSDAEGPAGDNDGSEVDAYYMNDDHRMLLQGVQHLLKSRNSAVVMQVCALYYHCAPFVEAQHVGKALTKLVRSRREIQYVVLSNIAAMASQRPSLFVHELTEFFIFGSDPRFIRSLKLEIMTLLATETNISVILRELKTYVKSGDTVFVTEAIQAVGRCAMRVHEVTESCLDGLMSLLTSRSEAVVAESVVAIKKLLQLNPSEIDSVVLRLSRLLDSITVPGARASIVWVVGEYSEKMPTYAPDVLRVLAKGFPAEDDITKLQILNLGAKLFLRNAEQTSLLFDYVLHMARYDTNYDIRDRARLLKTILKTGTAPTLAARSLEIFLADKPVPVVQSVASDRARFTAGTLSCLVNHNVEGYTDLPDWVEEEPDSAIRASEQNYGAFSGQASAASTLGGGTGGAASGLDPNADWGLTGFYDDEYSYYSDEDGGGGGGGGGGARRAPKNPGEYSYYSDDEGVPPSGGGGGGGGGGRSTRPKAAVVAGGDDGYSYYSEDEDAPPAAGATAAGSGTNLLGDLGVPSAGGAAGSGGGGGGGGSSLADLMLDPLGGGGAVNTSSDPMGDLMGVWDTTLGKDVTKTTI